MNMYLRIAYLLATYQEMITHDTFDDDLDALPPGSTTSLPRLFA